MKQGVLGRYAPSAQFTTIALALFLSAGLVYAAERVTAPQTSTLAVDASQTAGASDADNWQAALYAEQAANASSSITAPSSDIVSQFLQAAQSSNVTDTVAKTIFVNISSAKAQGLGDDTPTQDQIVATAASQVATLQTPAVTGYSYADLTIVPASSIALHTYGNAVIQTLNAQPNASEQATLLAIDEIVEGNDKSKASTLESIGAAYKAIATGLVAVPVPQTFAPLHLEAANDYLQLGATYDDMAAIGTDAVRGLRGLQAYENLLNENGTVFTNIAQELNKDGILFTKDEPGSAWGIFLPTPAVPGTQ